MTVQPGQLVQLTQELSVVVMVFLLIFWALMFRDMVRNDALPESAKTSWTLVFLLMNVFGAAIYYAVEYRKRQ
ncbi:MAG TPA: PLDc N-terminal domain-containing protein [Ktedonobacterales bacterium]|nr:PLDc N-terminal domain-containing protein [Ktedonobacterales bacterium]